MKTHILEVDSVQKQFGNKCVISSAYLKCETNDIIGLLGRNGSGKSTLLKIIFGIVPADNKFIKIDGIVKNSTNQLLQYISYLDQDNFVPSHFSVKKAISLTVQEDKLQFFYEDEMIQSIQTKNINQLSSGELRYLEIKLILSNSSKFALLDEPYNGLSPIMVDKVNQLIKDNSAQKGIVITDHNYENVIKISNKLMLMVDGNLHSLKDKNELFEKGYLKEGMI
ncbi:MULTISPECIES: ATP-binding cassette domain-containing protein [unclassified Flavobacterium]|uniref:ATP-binding cassette domain-containing protein n=1 Tax=unclassified Flavobacterium TaxID=196869 RepID=UPI0025C12117|nr:MULTISPECIES: ATP-binding cassette domain-containing protein [unclassified Flavobacterium]